MEKAAAMQTVLGNMLLNVARRTNAIARTRGDGERIREDDKLNAATMEAYRKRGEKPNQCRVEEEEGHQDQHVAE